MRPRLTSPGPKPRSSHRPRRLALIAALAIIAAIALPGATTPATAKAAAAGLAGRYVALGDSYAAGPGIPHLRITSGLCGRSTNNYPTLVAAELAPSAFTDVSCSGAETHHMTTRQHNNPPQYDALKPDTRVVTITIGGNDADFFKILAACAVGGVLVPDGSPCKKKYTKNGTDALDARIAAAMPKVAGVLQGIHERAPQAVVFLVGYPAVLPDAKDKCAMDIPLARGDVPYLNAKIQRFNQSLAAQATANGAIFVDTYTPSIGHEACQTSGTRWIEGIEGVQGAIPIHPNARGMAGMAAAVLAAMRAAAILPVV
ncbi:SGNH/GDSL hydrolase family protein [Thermopolyspora sp. NPDC052614]|uniref:SGNH/GDSL hydrolase family protein n=1 Tax=Thermopolyspora sp. NPDC052614 TaxID=3155682 RepID=UPI0034174129